MPAWLQQFRPKPLMEFKKSFFNEQPKNLETLSNIFLIASMPSNCFISLIDINWFYNLYYFTFTLISYFNSLLPCPRIPFYSSLISDITAFSRPINFNTWPWQHCRIQAATMFLNRPNTPMTCTTAAYRFE